MAIKMYSPSSAVFVHKYGIFVTCPSLYAFSVLSVRKAPVTLGSMTGAKRIAGNPKYSWWRKKSICMKHSYKKQQWRSTTKVECITIRLFCPATRKFGSIRRRQFISTLLPSSVGQPNRFAKLYVSLRASSRVCSAQWCEADPLNDIADRKRPAARLEVDNMWRWTHAAPAPAHKQR